MEVYGAVMMAVYEKIATFAVDLAPQLAARPSLMLLLASAEGAES